MKKVKVVLFLLTGVGLLIFVLSRIHIDIHQVVRSIVNPWYVVLAMVAMILSPLINAYRLKYLLFPMEKNPLSIKDLFVIEYISKFLYSVALFKLNLPAKALLLSKISRGKLSTSTSVIAFEYALDSSLTILFGFLGVLTLFRRDPNISLVSIEYFIVLALLSALVFFSIPADYFGTLLNYAEHFQLKIIRVISTFVLKVMWAIRSTWATILIHQGMFAVLLTTAIIWGAAVLINEFLFLSAGLYIPPTWILVVISSGTFVGGISGIPGGIGAREAAMIYLYGFLGIPLEINIAVVLISRILTLIPTLVGYALSLRLGFRLMEEKNV